MKKVIAVSQGMKKGMLDDDYTLYNSGEILHEYDNSIYPGGQNFSRTLSANDLSPEIKKRLLFASSDENKEIVKNILQLNI